MGPKRAGGSFPPNDFGLYDMAGNVWEWTSSVVLRYAYRSDDGCEDPRSREARVTRGGSWNANSTGLRVSHRDRDAPSFRGVSIGFRCARGLSP